MSLESQITELRQEHSTLTKLVAKLQRSPSVCCCEITRLKKQKLVLKQEIIRLTDGFTQSEQPKAEDMGFLRVEQSLLDDKHKELAAVGT